MFKFKHLPFVTLSVVLAPSLQANEGLYGSLQFGATEFVRTIPGSYGITEDPQSWSLAFGYKRVFASDIAFSGEFYYTNRDELNPLDVPYTPTALRDQRGVAFRLGQQQNRLWTYFILGYGKLDYISGNPNEIVSRSGLEYGFGTEFSVTPKIALRAEVKTYSEFVDGNGFDSNDQSQAVQYSLGATYYFTAMDELEPAQSAEAFSGFYAGLSTSGLSVQRVPFTDQALFQSAITDFGAYVGYNRQVGNNFILGGELAISKPNEDPDVTGGPPFTTDRFTTVSARLGYASGRNMVYLRGGALRIDVSDNAAADPDGYNWGSEFGFGVETLISNRFLVRIEYTSGQFDQPEYEDDVDGQHDIRKLTLGIGYKF